MRRLLSRKRKASIVPLEESKSEFSMEKETGAYQQQHIANGSPADQGLGAKSTSHFRWSISSERMGGSRAGDSGRTQPMRLIYQWVRNVRAVLEDWLFLALLGVFMAICSLSMDFAIEHLQTWHMFTINLASSNTYGHANTLATFSLWTGYVVLLTVLSALIVRTVASQAIGSGIPEMKTILRGVILKEYLTFRTLISKMFGLTLSLGSGMPIGKEGPFVHIASIVANLLSQLVHSSRAIYANESRSYEMLAAACAVGVSSTFSAPIGGVLFSIEVTSVYFAVRNYWRAFFAATCSATLFRVLRVLMKETEVTVTAFYQTEFPRDSFFPEELPVFALVGVICGFLSASFIYMQRKCILFLRKNKLSKIVFQKYWVIYPALIALIVASLTFPKGFGRFLAGEKRFSQTAKDFFADCTWSVPEDMPGACPRALIATWSREGDFSHFTSLPCFIGTYFLLSILASTLPIPCGIFGPSFVLGAAVGRLMGEIMADLYPEGIRGVQDTQIFPGVYAVVGSAAFCGGVTHTVSVAVIIFELTGQLFHILPVMIAVLISNAICSFLQPSIYDSAIKIKRLPFLPDIPHTSSRFHGIRVEQFMTRGVVFFSSDSTTYAELQEALTRHSQLKTFPIVESQSSRILIGSCGRSRLLRALEFQIGPEARLQEACRRFGPLPAGQMRKKQSWAGNGLNWPSMGRSKSTERNLSGEKEGRRKNGKSYLVVPLDKGDEQEMKTGGSLDRLTPLADGHRHGSGLSPPGTKKAANGPATVKRSQTIPATLAVDSTATEAASGDVYSTIGGMIRSLARFSHRLRKNTSDQQVMDLVGEERVRWERDQLERRVDFAAVSIDPAPFQLVEQTSLFKVHSLFSMLGLGRAYVTNCGRLVGVVALRDLRMAVERVQSGELTADSDIPTGQPASEITDQPPETRTPETDTSSDDEDQARDILNPPLKVVSQADPPAYKGERRRQSAAAGLPGLLQMKASEALAGAANLAKGMLAKRNSSAEEAEKREEGAQKKPAVPVFVISFSEHDNNDNWPANGQSRGEGARPPSSITRPQQQQSQSPPSLLLPV